MKVVSASEDDLLQTSFSFAEDIVVTIEEEEKAQNLM